MDDKKLKNLIDKFLSGDINQVEQNLLFATYEKLQENPEAWNNETMGIKEQVSNRIHSGIMTKIENKERKSVILWQRWSMAASFLFLIGLTFFIYDYAQNTWLNTNDSNNRFVISPGANSATLTLADGSTISLNELDKNESVKQGEISFKKEKDGLLTYQMAESTQEASAINTIQTPKGGKYEIVLPDGTKVWLNAMSKISFPVSFSSKERRIELNGEAYFEVAKSRTPFVVKTNKQEIEVLGTHFNVQNYNDELTSKTTLIEGLVQINLNESTKPQLLQPGYQATISDKITIKEADLQETLAWKNGYFQFTDADLQSTLRQISRWYNVDIIYEANFISKKKFTGRLPRNTDFVAVLEILKYFDIKFEIKSRELHIKKINTNS